jgi:hypothetical protein
MEPAFISFFLAIFSFVFGILGTIKFCQWIFNQHYALSISTNKVNILISVGCFAAAIFMALLA